MRDPHTDAELDWSVVARYLADELSSEDRGRFEQWLDQDSRRRTEMAELQRLWNTAGALPSPSRMRSMWSAITAHLPGAGAAAVESGDAAPPGPRTDGVAPDAQLTGPTAGAPATRSPRDRTMPTGSS